MANYQANDAMIRRLEKELEERNSAAQGIIANAEDGERDLNSAESETLKGLRNRMGELKEQIVELEATAEAAQSVSVRMKELDQAITTARRVGSQTVEYRSAGAFLLDTYKASQGDRTAGERLEVYLRAAAHQKTTDNPGVVPTPVIGEVINFIDASRPLVTAIGPRDMPAGTFYRPRVTQHTAVLVQGAAGAAADEKTELTSQKMTISRITVNAKTYGGYVNVSRQNIDFSSPQIMDIIIQDLAGVYAQQTEAATAAELDASLTTPVGYGASPTADSITAAIWTAASTAWNLTKGAGRLILALAPDRLAVFGKLFAPISPVNSQSPGFTAGDFNSGAVSTIGGIPVVVSAGLASTKAFLFSTAAIEVYEQRVGSLQAVEPSVLGVQVAYAGYFNAVTIDDDAIIELTAT